MQDSENQQNNRVRTGISLLDDHQMFGTQLRPVREFAPKAKFVGQVAKT